MRLSKVASLEAAVPASLSGVVSIAPAGDMTFSLYRKAADNATMPGDAFQVDGEVQVSAVVERELAKVLCQGSFPATGAIVRANVVNLNRGKGYVVGNTFHLINNGLTGATTPHDEVVTVTEVYPDGGIKQYTLGGQGSAYTLGRATADAVTGNANATGAIFQINQVGTWTAAEKTTFDLKVDEVTADETYKVFIGKEGTWRELALTDDYTIHVDDAGSVDLVVDAQPGQYVKAVAYTNGTSVFTFAAPATTHPQSTSTGVSIVETSDDGGDTWVDVTTDVTISGTGGITLTFASGAFPDAGLLVRYSKTFALGNKVAIQSPIDASAHVAEVYKVYVAGTLKTVTTDYTVESGYIKFAANKSPAKDDIVQVKVLSNALVCVQGDAVEFSYTKGGYGYSDIIPTGDMVCAIAYE
jgi:hypothetical protein